MFVSVSFGLGFQLLCPEKLVSYDIDLIFGNEQELLGIFGCRNVDDNSHDEGAWVVASTNKDLPNNPQELLEQFREAVLNISAAVTDFLINDFSMEHSCSCPSCSYSMECPKEETETVYNYYDGVDYSNYPQYEANYDYASGDYESDSYSDYPNYYNDAPAYYYYDDDYKSYDEDDIMNMIEKNLKDSTTETVQDTTILDEYLTINSVSQGVVDDLSTTEFSISSVTDFVTNSGENTTQTLQDFQMNDNETFKAP